MAKYYYYASAEMAYKPELPKLTEHQNNNVPVCFSPEAFALFTATLKRKRFFLLYHDWIDQENQRVKVRLKVVPLPEWKEELRI